MGLDVLLLWFRVVTFQLCVVARRSVWCLKMEALGCVVCCVWFVVCGSVGGVLCCCVCWWFGGLVGLVCFGLCGCRFLWSDVVYNFVVAVFFPLVCDRLLWCSLFCQKASPRI